MKITAFIISVLLTGFINSEFNYKIDESVSKEIDRLMDENANFMLHINETFDFENLQIEDATDLSFFMETQSLLNITYIPAFTCECLLKGDTIIVEGGQGYAGVVAFRIRIFNDKSDGKVYLQTTQNVYSDMPDTNTLKDEIVLKIAEMDLTLSKLPAFVLGDTIKGKAHIKAKPFYQMDINRNLVELNTEFDILFTGKVDQYIKWEDLNNK